MTIFTRVQLSPRDIWVCRLPGVTCQFARVVKGVDLRSTAGNCARVRTPQLTLWNSIFPCLSRLPHLQETGTRTA